MKKQFIGGGFPALIEKKNIVLEEETVKKREFSLKNILPIDSILPKRKKVQVKRPKNSQKISNDYY